jgi:hypothetical protein
MISRFQSIFFPTKNNNPVNTPKIIIIEIYGLKPNDVGRIPRIKTTKPTRIA